MSHQVAQKFEIHYAHCQARELDLTVCRNMLRLFRLFPGNRSESPDV